MKLLKTLLLFGAVLAAAPAAAHTYAYDDGNVRVVYNTHGHYGGYARDNYWPYYSSYPYVHHHRHHGHRHHHYRGCGHDYRHERHRHHRHGNRH